MRRENRLATELDAVGLGVGTTTRGALQNASAFQLCGDAKDGEDDLGKIRVERVNDFDTAGGRSLGSEFWFL
jgi:hypothetical protein